MSVMEILRQLPLAPSRGPFLAGLFGSSWVVVEAKAQREKRSGKFARQWRERIRLFDAAPCHTAKSFVVWSAGSGDEKHISYFDVLRDGNLNRQFSLLLLGWLH